MTMRIPSADIAPRPTLVPCIGERVASAAIKAFIGPGGTASRKPKTIPSTKS